MNRNYNRSRPNSLSLHRATLRNSFKAEKILSGHRLYPKGRDVAAGHSRQELRQIDENGAGGFDHFEDRVGRRHKWIYTDGFRPYSEFPDKPLEDAEGRDWVFEEEIDKVLSWYSFRLPHHHHHQQSHRREPMTRQLPHQNPLLATSTTAADRAPAVGSEISFKGKPQRYAVVSVEVNPRGVVGKAILKLISVETNY